MKSLTLNAFNGEEKCALTKCTKTINRLSTRENFSLLLELMVKKIKYAKQFFL